MRIKVYILRSLSLLSYSERKRFFLLLITQSFLSLLDIIGIAAVGIIGFVAINGYSGTSTPGLTGSTISMLGLDSVSFNSRILILSLFASSIQPLQDTTHVIDEPKSPNPTLPQERGS